MAWMIGRRESRISIPREDIIETAHEARQAHNAWPVTKASALKIIKSIVDKTVLEWRRNMELEEIWLNAQTEMFNRTRIPDRDPLDLVQRMISSFNKANQTSKIKDPVSISFNLHDKNKV